MLATLLDGTALYLKVGGQLVWDFISLFFKLWIYYMHWIYLLHVSHNHLVGVYKENVLIRRAHLQIKCYFIPKKNQETLLFSLI